MLPQTRELFKHLVKSTYNRFEWVGNGQSFVKTFNGGNDNYLTVHIDSSGGYRVILKRHAAEQLLDSHTGVTISQNGLKGHQEKQDRDLAIAVFNIVAEANLGNYQKIIDRLTQG